MTEETRARFPRKSVQADSKPSARPESLVRIPTILWGYWAQGFENAPEIVQICVESWKQNSEGLEIRLLDAGSLPEWLSIDELPVVFDSLSHQKKANAIRLALLKKYGGVWADSTIFLTAPISTWLEQVQSRGGLFVFQAKGKDFRFPNWFIAAAEGHRFIAELDEEYAKYFSVPRIDFKGGSEKGGKGLFLIYKFLVFRPVRRLKLINSNWNKFPLSALPFFPFRIFHYLGNSILKRDKLHEAEFESMANVGSSEPSAGKGSHIGREWVLNRNGILTNTVPVNKLSKGDYSESDRVFLRSIIATSK